MKSKNKILFIFEYSIFYFTLKRNISQYKTENKTTYSHTSCFPICYLI